MQALVPLYTGHCQLALTGSNAQWTSTPRLAEYYRLTRIQPRPITEDAHGVRVLAEQPAKEHVQHDSERQGECVKLPISRHAQEPAVSFAWSFSACSSDCLAATTIMSSAHSRSGL
jgi:hypothetical protein